MGVGLVKRIEIPSSHFIDNIEVDPVEGLPPLVKDILDEMVDNLPDEYRKVVEMRIWMRLSFRAIAKKLNYKSHSGVYEKYQQALEMLRKEINIEDS